MLVRKNGRISFFSGNSLFSFVMKVEAYLGYMAPGASLNFAPPPIFSMLKKYEKRSLYCDAVAKIFEKILLKIVVFG